LSGPFEKGQSAGGKAIKIAITGKGGAGKTTVAVMLARYLAEAGQKVIVLDADPDANTAMALGIAPEDCPEPVSDLKGLIAERTGARGGGGEFFTLNPRVDDIPERYAVDADGVKLLRMGRLAQGGGGCFCPENAFLKNLLAYLFFSDDQTVILDMEAGVEHLGRGTAQGVDRMLVVVEPGRRSIATARTIKQYAADIGLTSPARTWKGSARTEEPRSRNAWCESFCMSSRRALSFERGATARMAEPRLQSHGKYRSVPVWRRR